MGKIKIGGIIQSKELALVGMISTPDRPGLAGEIFAALGNEKINIQFIVQSVDRNGRGNIFFCIDCRDLDEANRVLEELQTRVGCERLSFHSPVGIISIFGPHFRERPGIAGTFFAALNSKDINIMAISTSISTCSCVIPSSDLLTAVKAIGEFFDVPGGEE